MMDMTWSPIQQEALAAVRAWTEATMVGRGDQVFRLFGYAGTGKTTLAIHLAAEAGQVLFGAFTGKAALVLQKKGCHNATTLHRMIYLPREKSRKRLHKMQQELATLNSPTHTEEDWHEARRDELPGLIGDEQKSLKQPVFTLNEDSDVDLCDLIVVAAVSMVGARRGEDLLSGGKHG